MKQEKGMKFDEGKTMFNLVDPTFLESVANVLTKGAEKYSPDNWKEVPNPEQRYMAAALRHINAYQRGEYFDRETGLPHLSHAVCCLMFLFWFDHVDDRGF